MPPLAPPRPGRAAPAPAGGAGRQLHSRPATARRRGRSSLARRQQGGASAQRREPLARAAASGREPESAEAAEGGEEDGEEPAALSIDADLDLSFEGSSLSVSIAYNNGAELPQVASGRTTEAINSCCRRALLSQQ